MKISLTNFKWLESWERSKQHNVEVGFNNHALLRGYLSENTFPSMEQLPDVNFFLELAKLKPKLYAENEITYGEISCCVDEKKYKAIYYYDRNSYMLTDENDTIIKRLEIENS